MGRTILFDVDGRLLQAVLPEPGDPNSLSDSKQISIYGTDPNEHFDTTWEVESADRSITLPAGQASGAYTVYWGDGQAGYNITGDAAHEYADPGSYTISTWNLDRIRLGGDEPNAAKLRSIDQWGTVRWASMSEAFWGGLTHDARGRRRPRFVGGQQHGADVPGGRIIRRRRVGMGRLVSRGRVPHVPGGRVL